MISRGRGALVVLGAVIGLAVASWPAVAAAALKYPDLRTVPLRDVRLGTVAVGTENHYIVRFTNEVHNAGQGPFELHGTPHFPIDGLFDADQWIYDDTAGVDVQRVGTFVYHPNHSHFHFDGFARFELWSKRGFERAQARNFTTGSPLYTSPKVSFCVFDFNHYDTSSGPSHQVYRTCTPVLEGISQGWSDIYSADLPDQWVDVGQKPLPDGDYVLRSVADPDNAVFESAGKADPARESQVANSASKYISIVNGRLAPTP